MRHGSIRRKLFWYFIVMSSGFALAGFGMGCATLDLSEEGRGMILDLSYGKNGASFLKQDASLQLVNLGEKFTGDAFMRYNDTAMFFVVNTVFGTPLFSFSRESDSVAIRYGDHEFYGEANTLVREIPLFANYPFNFYQLDRILSGRIILERETFDLLLRKLSDSSSETVVVSDSLYRYELSGVRSKKMQIVVSPVAKQNSWSLGYSFFSRGTFKKVYFLKGESDEIVLKFK